jgi:adenosine tuberculosinyltransferase
MIDRETFLNLPLAELAQLVRQAGPQVCAFPINGSRRWFLLEHPPEEMERLGASYFDLIIRRYIELFQLCFDHGLDTLLSPVFGPELLQRGEAYAQAAINQLSRLATDPIFLNFYQTYQVRVRFYGAYRQFLAATPYAHLANLFDQITAQTVSNNRYRLFYGLCGHDPAENVAEIGVNFYQQRGRLPNKAEIVTAYYGEPVEPVSLFIGFDKFSAFDMPLLATGSENLYFTVSPSPYLSARQLRDILYDHLYARPGDVEFETLSPAEWNLMREFYQANLDHTQGVGIKYKGIWFPLPGVNLPAVLKNVAQD